MLSQEWTLYWHHCFKTTFLNLLVRVHQQMKEDPDDFDQHPSYKFYQSIKSTIGDRILPNPNGSEFRLGKTLRAKNMTHWRRAKHGLPNRYRLFFQFNSVEKGILLAWINDDNTLRKTGSKTDVYTVFKYMVNKGDIPNFYNDCKAVCSPADSSLTNKDNSA